MSFSGQSSRSQTRRNNSRTRSARCLSQSGAVEDQEDPGAAALGPNEQLGGAAFP